MKKDFKVIQIHGLTGLLLVVFLGTGLFCGFVVFPVWLLMSAWNVFITDVFKMPEIGYTQAGMLWAFLVLLLYASFKNSFSMKIQKGNDIDTIDIGAVINEVDKIENQETLNDEAKK